MRNQITLIFVFVLFLSSSAFPQHKESKSITLQSFYNNLANAEISVVNSRKQLKLKDLKAPTLVVVFFASWCRPCVLQAEEIKKIKREFSEYKLQAVGINVDFEDRKDFQKLARHGIFNYVLGEMSELLTRSLMEDLVKIGKVDAIPYTIVINNGEIKEVFVGGGFNIHKKLRENLKEIYSKSINENNNRAN